MRNPLRRRTKRHEIRIPGEVFITVDEGVNALYVRFRTHQGVPLRTVTLCESPVVNLDMSGDLPIGVEVLW